MQELIGTTLDSFTYQVDKVKIRELALAIGDLREEYLKGEKLPPTFPTVIEYWGEGYNNYDKLGFDIKKVLHGEQEYEYIGKICPGDEITVTSVIEDAYTKAAMNFVKIKREYRNQNGELVLISRSTLIEKH